MYKLKTFAELRYKEIERAMIESTPVKYKESSLNLLKVHILVNFYNSSDIIRKTFDKYIQEQADLTNNSKTSLVLNSLDLDNYYKFLEDLTPEDLFDLDIDESCHELFLLFE